jgi:putative radical SAM enzyme (TIGR03279 family)
VHATLPDVRVRLLRNRRAGQIMEQLRLLAGWGIEVHAQVVLCPGVNDGPVLDRTLEDLASLWPTVLSVAVVPVGLTRFREKLPVVRAVGPEEAAEVVAQLEAWRAHFLGQLGTRFVFGADELYLKAGIAVPPREAYESFPQVEDGIGLVRLFLDEMTRVRRLKPLLARRPRRVLLVTGTLAYPILDDLASELTRLTGHHVEALAVPNRFFGESITVAGLLTGEDVIETLRRAGPADRVYIPDVLLRADRFLDDITVGQVSAMAGVEIVPVAPSPRELARHLRRPWGGRAIAQAEQGPAAAQRTFGGSAS